MFCVQRLCSLFSSNIALLKYCAKSKSLSNPNCPLSSKLKPEMIESANRKVSALLASTGSSSVKEVGSGQRLRGSYMKFTRTVRTWKTKYTEELRKRKSTEPLPIKAMPDRKQGRPLLLGDELDTAVGIGSLCKSLKAKFERTREMSKHKSRN